MIQQNSDKCKFQAPFRRKYAINNRAHKNQCLIEHRPLSTLICNNKVTFILITFKTKLFVMFIILILILLRLDIIDNLNYGSIVKII